MRLSKANGYEKTEWELMVCMSTYTCTWRKVWKKDDKFYVSYDGEICDVTFAKDRFVHWN